MPQMDREHYQRVKAIFAELCDRPSDQRARYLDSCCADDSDLRTDVEALLSHYETPSIDFDAVGSRLSKALSDAANGISAECAALPSSIGPYRILRLLGEGGMGAVYLAEQERPKRQVAVKIIKPGFVSQNMLRRFEHEAQTLARLQHPGIARIYDAGTTDDGSPYLAMEFVDGEPIIEYCDKRRLSIPARLTLFMAVCEAVQHAHMRGVIHRDLKPSNVLVVEERTQIEQSCVRPNGAAVHANPVVIDFGVAKALDEHSANQFVLTNAGVLIGTLVYMSPEQAAAGADGEESDVDVRSDVYALGVVLYQMLTGCLPVDPSQLRGKSTAQRERLLWEEPLPKPSNRIRRLFGSDEKEAQRIAHNRQVDTSALARYMQGELDCIVSKCLSVERDHRYDSVATLLEDLRRYMRHEPILARPPSAAYQLRKFARRHWALMGSISVVFASLLIGMVGVSWGLMHAIAEADRAGRESQRALAAESAASQRAAELEQVVAFQSRQLSSIDAADMGRRFRSGLLDTRLSALHNAGYDEGEARAALHFVEQMLSEVNFTALALQVLDESMFDTAIQEIEDHFTDQPEVQARLFQTIAFTMRWNGLLEQATYPQTRAVDIRRRVLGDAHPSTLRSTLEMGRLLKIQGRRDEAEPLIHEATVGLRHALGNEHRTTLYAINILGVALRAQGRVDEAEPYYREALEGFRRTLPEDHDLVLFSLANMGSLLRDQGRIDEAEPLVREALEGKRQRFGNDHLETLLSMMDLGLLLRAQENFIEAEIVLREALDRAKRSFGDDHFSALGASHCLGVVLHEKGDITEAEAHYRRALEGRCRVFGNDHSETIETARCLTALLTETDRSEQAAALIERFQLRTN